MSRLTKQRLRAMRERWSRDLKVLEEAFPDLNLDFELGAEAETVRNLATAIGEVNGIIANQIPLQKRRSIDVRVGADFTAALAAPPVGEI